MSGVWIWNAISQSLKIQGAIGILDLSVWILGLLTLLSGIIGISNIMFVSVKERTHEIGIRRAIGAKPHKILIQILSESVAITTLFGYIGIIMGTALTELLTNMIQDSFMSYVKVDLALAAQVTVVLIIAGALAGLFPALKALKVKPVEALRDE
jgi:putative ABC transport system permease protein